MSRTLGGTVRAAVDFLGKIDRGEHGLGDRSIIGWGPLLPQNEAGRQQRKNGETQCLMWRAAGIHAPSKRAASHGARPDQVADCRPVVEM